MKKKIKYFVGAAVLAVAVIFSVSAYMINLNAKDNDNAADESSFSESYNELNDENDAQALEDDDYAVKKNMYLP